ncbi:RNA-binding protein 43-like [Protopterus annectens]|uniref:RNA-binding protein 43-like n=1 Tax=Protopterus annectens TaxID=7888 RepID=UPI001CFAF36F|nr:RNA-binding protein 43-like [Protopterus annectens]
MASSDWMALGRADEKSSDAKERTITVSGFPDRILPDDEMSDKLIIHFQKSKNGGGDVETIYYPAKIPGVAYIVFDDIKVAKRVLGKEHIFEDPRIHGRYKLNISLYSEDVFTSVSVILDLSIFHKKYRLLDFVQHLKESFLSLTLSEIYASGRLSVTGPFSAIKKLREYVLSEIEALTYNDIFLSQRTEKQSSEYFSKNVLSLDMTPGKRLIDDIVTNKEMLFVDTDIYKYMIHICRNQYEKELKKHNIKASIHEMGEITVVYLENERSNQNNVKLAKKQYWS